jgi:electron transfer flavoprotein beta subunit
VITTQRGLNEPRYASMPKIMKAKKMKIESLSMEQIGITDDTLFSSPKMQVKSLQVPQKSRAGIMIEGDTPKEKAENLLKHLRENAQVI